jgi:shikimate dehydrogenase
MGQDPMPPRVALIGHPVAHSRSPVLQQAGLDACGIPARYELWDTPPEALAARVAELRAPNVLGANVTVPHKRAVMPLLDDLAPSAERLAGAVNTIVAVQSAGGTRLVGHSTDPAGLRAALAEVGITLAGQRVVLLGAGGAAHAVAGLVASDGARSLLVAARSGAAAIALVEDVARRLPESTTVMAATSLVSGALPEALGACGLLINATSVGMGEGVPASPLDIALLAHCPAGTLVCDLVYAPPETLLLRAAQQRGLRTLNGLPMLLYQGAAAFTLWTGVPAPEGVMRAALGLAPRR